MVTLLLDSTQLEVVLSGFERTAARRSAPVRIERSLIQKVQLTDDAWTWLRGVPSPGTLIRGTLAMGTWTSAGGVDFVVVRRRHPAVVVDLDAGAEFSRLVLTTRHGLQLVQALRLQTSATPTDVIRIVAGDAVPAPESARAPHPPRAGAKTAPAPGAVPGAATGPAPA